MLARPLEHLVYIESRQHYRKGSFFFLFEREKVKFSSVCEKTAKRGIKRDRGRATHGARDGGFVIARLGD